MQFLAQYVSRERNGAGLGLVRSVAPDTRLGALSSETFASIYQHTVILRLSSCTICDTLALLRSMTV